MIKPGELFFVWLTVHRSSMLNKKATRRHLVLYLFLLYKLLKFVSCATYSPMDTQPANRIWPPTQPRHYNTSGKNTTKSSAPEDGHKVARNMLSNL